MDAKRPNSPIEHVKIRTQEAIRVDLGGDIDVFSMPIVRSAVGSQVDESRVLPFLMQVFFGSLSLAFISSLVVIQAVRPILAPHALAGRVRQLPQTVCRGTSCFGHDAPVPDPVKTSPVPDNTKLEPVPSSSSSSSKDSIFSEFSPFKRFHAAPPESPKPAPRRGDNVQGVYLGASSVKRTDFLDDTIAALKESGGNAIVIDVKGGFVFFNTESPIAHELDLVRPLYDLPAIVEKLHQEDIYVIARFVAIKDHEYTRVRPESRIKHPKTGAVISETWIDPSDDDAIEYNMQVVCDVAKSGIDEMNADYIRWTTERVNSNMAFSTEEKVARVGKFVHAMRETIDRCNPETKLGLSTFAILGWDYDANIRTLGQAFDVFADDVDIISPMAYPQTFGDTWQVPKKYPNMSRDYYLVYNTLKGYAERLGPEKANKLRPWIQGYYVTPQRMKDQIQAVYDAGFCGFQVWNANNNYGPVYVAMSSMPEKPERCL